MAYTPPGAGAFTTIHFVFIALLAVATVLVILAGIRRARARRHSDRRVETEAAEAGVPEAPPAPGPSGLSEAPLEAQSLDRSAAGFAPPPPANDDLAHPHPVAPAPGEIEPHRNDAPPSRTAIADEPIAAAAPMDASPATVAEPARADAATLSPADGPVTQLKGLGPKVAARLAEIGIASVGQIAALDADQAQELDARLGPFAGRLHRDRWVEQARFLAAGDRAGFEAVFGKL